MGKDKSHICYQDSTPEWQRLAQLLENCCDSAFLCHRAEQNFEGFENSIIDPGTGPLKAIACAQQEHPEAAWLVLACDLPLLTQPTLEHLISQRDPSSQATCFASNIDSMPEPLCAIYEPSIAATIQARLTSNNSDCPRSVLKQANTKLVPLPANAPHALLNTNSQADAIEVRAILEGTQTEKSISLRYFAQLRELTGRDHENYQTKSCTPSGLYEEIKTIYKFPYKQKHLMLAINGDFSPWHSLLQPADEVVFIPPVAGG